MALLYGALAYMVGIILGRILFDAAGLECPLPGWLWLAPLAFLPLTALLKRKQPTAPPSLRWPVSAGFDPPATGVNPALVAAVLLCATAGALRYAGQPFTQCWSPGDLAYYNLPASQAFERSAPKVTVTGFIDSYPLVADVKQEMVVSAATIEVDGTPQPVAGKVRLTTGIRERYAYGQPVRVSGRLVTPPEFEDFSYREYLARKGIHSLFYSARIDVLEGAVAGQSLDRNAVHRSASAGKSFSTAPCRNPTPRWPTA